MPRQSFTVPLPDGASLELGARTLVMGVLNVTPDSFADGGRFIEPSRAADAALAMEAAGADLIDVGGESTRPGAEPVSADEERARIEPVFERLAGHLKVPALNRHLQGHRGAGRDRPRRRHRQRHQRAKV